MINISEIKEELKYCYGDSLKVFLGENPMDCNESIWRNKFNEHASLHSIKIKIKDLVEEFQEKSFAINTPDGFQRAGDFYIKGPKSLYDIKTKSGYQTIGSNDHKFESSKGWKFSENLLKGDLILTKEGFQEILEPLILPEEKVYDLEILHENHRYWSGNGLSSHNTAKTFIAMSIVRNSLKMGYHPIYFDSEGAIDVEFTKRLGVDPSKIRLDVINTIEDFSHMSAKIVEQIDEMKKKGEEPPKILIVLDSLGNMTSSKEKADAISGSDKRDMTKQQAIRKLFRVNGIDFARLGIPFVVVAHTYDSMSMFSPKEISGGGGVKYNASIILALGKGGLKDDDAKKIAEKKGLDPSKLGVTIFVNPFKQRFARPIKIQIHIPFYKPLNPYVGLEKFLSWEIGGVMRGSIITEKEYEKLTPAAKKKCEPLIFEEENTKSGEFEKVTKYACPNDKAHNIVLRNEKCTIPVKELFSERVFTEEVLREMDEKVIKETFQLPDLFSLEEEQEDLKVLLGDVETDGEENSED